MLMRPRNFYRLTCVIGLVAVFGTGSSTVAYAAVFPGWTTAAIDTGGVVGPFSSITIGRDGLGLISYSSGFPFVLKVAHCLSVACSIVTAVAIDTDEDVGRFASITIGSDGLPLISYMDLTKNDLKVAHCSIPECIPE